jgi:hypothetical protein
MFVTNSFVFSGMSYGFLLYLLGLPLGLLLSNLLSPDLLLGLRCLYADILLLASEGDLDFFYLLGRDLLDLELIL